MKTIRVIEWPDKGSAKRFPTGGWWVVIDTLGRGFSPLAGPFATQDEAIIVWKEKRLEDHEPQRPASSHRESPGG